MAKKLFVALIALSLALCFTPVYAETKQVNILTAPFGTGGNALTSALEELSKTKNSGTGIRIIAVETPGIIYNIKKMGKATAEERKNTLFIVSKLTAWMASKPLKPFKKKYESPLLIANYGGVSFWLATTNPKIKTYKDLVGKRIGLGRAAQPIYGTFPTWLIEKGWGIKDEVDIQAIGLKPSVKGLMDGRLDAAIINGFINPVTGKILQGPMAIELLSTGRNVNHIPWGLDAVKKLNASGIPMNSVVIPSGVIKGVDKNLEIVTDPCGWVADPEFPEDLAYKVTKFIIQSCKEIGTYHSIGKLMTPSSLTYGWPKERIHPGALKAYKEAGLID